VGQKLGEFRCAGSEHKNVSLARLARFPLFGGGGTKGGKEVGANRGYLWAGLGPLLGGGGRGTSLRPDKGALITNWRYGGKKKTYINTQRGGGGGGGGEKAARKRRRNRRLAAGVRVV